VAVVDRLLEREAVLAELHRCRRAAGRGCGRLVLLRGEAGVGKTAVIAKFVAGLGPEARVLRGWCDGLATPRPLGPLLDMLAGLPAAQAAAMRAAIDAGDSEAIYAGLVGVFGDGNAWVCVIEDLHWADGATLDLLRFVSRRIESLPVLVVVSYRDDEIGPQHPLAVLLGDVATMAMVTRIGLDPLSAAGVAALAAGSGVNADALYRLTGGNPFFVTEVLAAGPDALGDGGLPRSVSEAVAGRLARLSATGRETTQAAAVCGPRAHPALLEAVCPAAAGALAECLHAGVLIANADTVGFRHELARRATAEQIPDYQRRLLHKRTLTVLAEAPIDPNTLAALAFHADRAGDTDAVIGHAPAAAERAAALGANREAAELYALVLRHADTTPDQQKVIWLERHAFSSYLSGVADASVRSLRAAITLRHTLGDRLGEGDDLRWLSRMLFPLGRTTEALQAARASLRLLEDLGPTPQLAWSLLNMAEQTAFGYDPACADYAARAITLGAQLGEPAMVIRGRCSAALATALRTDTGWDELEVAWRDAIAMDGQAELAATIGAFICWIAALHHDLDRAERKIAEAAPFCSEQDLGGFASLVTGADALLALHRGAWDRAAACAEDVLTGPALSPLSRFLPLITLALIAARRARPVGSLLDEALAAAEPDDFFRSGAVWAARAEVAWLAGDDDTARSEAQAGLAVAPDHADPWLVGHLSRWVYLAGGDPPQPIIGDPVTPYHLEIHGDWQAAVDAWTRLGCPYDAAIAQLGGDIGAVQAALGTFRRLGARTAARRAQQRLAQLRGRNPDLRRKDTSTDPHGLTNRQRDVLELLAAGHSDTEIATALCISPKTANTHVCAIMTKLGVRNRTQAAAYAHQQTPSPQ
jgi:DNA-binding CsgD family transcriptional regulator/tetratricopeptide (TPR) repeat protein